MAKTPIAASWTANSTSPYADQSYPNGDRGAGGIAPNSGAVLSGGSALRGIYDFDSGLSPSDGFFSSGAGTGATMTFSNNYAMGTWDYTQSGDPYMQIDISALNTAEFYIQFDARYVGDVWGCKFVKPRGKTDAIGQANMTCGPNFASGQDIERVSFGDGSTTSNDTQMSIRFDGSTDAGDVGRGWATSSITTENGKFLSTDWGAGWHTFKMYFRLSSGTSAGTDTPDGAFFLSIDDVVYCDASGFYNRHYDNSPHWDYITLMETAQGHSQDIEMHMDNIIVTTDGFV